jgi:alpha-L-fucosidase 2
MRAHVVVLAAAFAVVSTDLQAEAPHTLWYRRPAPQWDHALPLGNGRLGAMVFGQVNRERIQLNENTLWMGGPRDTNNPEALAALPEVRRLLFAGRPNEAYTIAEKRLMGRPFRVVPDPWRSPTFVRLRR